MVKHLYEFIEKQGLKNPLTGQLAINFMKETSFTLKLYHMCMIIVEKFFPPWLLWKNSFSNVPHHKDNVEYWVIEIFQLCQKHNDLLYMIFNIHSLFPNGDNP
jgi:hypothetical protein